MADTLSCLEEITIPSTVSFEELAEAQQKDQELRELVTSLQTNLPVYNFDFRKMIDLFGATNQPKAFNPTYHYH